MPFSSLFKTIIFKKFILPNMLAKSKLKLQHFGHLMRRVDSLEKTLMLGGIGGRRRGRQKEMAGWHHWLYGCESEWLWELVMDREAWRAAIHGVAKSRTRLRTELNWTELNWSIFLKIHTSNMLHSPNNSYLLLKRL